MSKAIIKVNKAYCPNCEQHDYKVTGTFQEEQSCRIEARCNKCSCIFNYNYKCCNMVDKRF